MEEEIKKDEEELKDLETMMQEWGNVELLED